VLSFVRGVEKNDALVRARREWLQLVGTVVPIAAVIVLFMFGPPAELVLISLAVQWACLVAWSRWPQRFRGALIADADGVRVDGRLLLARRRVSTAFLRRASPHSRCGRSVRGAVSARRPRANRRRS
jgi:hypothetical protein